MMKDNVPGGLYFRKLQQWPCLGYPDLTGEQSYIVVRDSI